jgi:hypothetical protein
MSLIPNTGFFNNENYLKICILKILKPFKNQCKNTTCGAPGILFRYSELAQITGEKSGQ